VEDYDGFDPQRQRTAQACARLIFKSRSRAAPEGASSKKDRKVFIDICKLCNVVEHFVATKLREPYLRSTDDGPKSLKMVCTFNYRLVSPKHVEPSSESLAGCL
jgi:hypothetical protein